MAARRTFNVDPDTHIDSLEQAEQITIEGTSKWSCKIAITGLQWSFAAPNRTLAKFDSIRNDFAYFLYTTFWYVLKFINKFKSEFIIILGQSKHFSRYQKLLCNFTLPYFTLLTQPIHGR